MTRLSIIIPGYNNPDAYWKRCLDSVIAACGPDDEIICVDDGSQVRPKVEKVGGEGGESKSRVEVEGKGRVRWLYLEKNVGQSAARNRALEMAQGEWVTFVDSDDAVNPDVYACCFETLKKNPNADVVLFGVRGVWARERMTRVDVLPSENLGVLTATSSRRIYDNRLFEYVWNKIYRRRLLVEHDILFEPGICPGEDTVFNLRCALAGARWILVDVVGYNYNRVDGTSLSRYLPKRADSLKRKAELWRQFAQQVGDSDGCLTELATFTEADWARTEWYNIWRKGSPLSLSARWRFLKEHSDSFRRPLWVTYLRKMIFTFLRTYCYFGWVYRWHIRRLFPDMERLPK